MPKHDRGRDRLPPTGLDWRGYVEAVGTDCESLDALADELIRRGAADTEIPADPQSVHDGLRQLAERGHQPGGEVGQWMLRVFGVPASVERWASWMGQFHSRFSDLPTSLRMEQLSLWDRPPISESRVAAWIHVGMASVHLQMRDLDACGRRLDLAGRAAGQAGPSAAIEVALLATKIASDGGDRERASQLMDQVEIVLADPGVDAMDRVAYYARLVGHRADHLTRPREGEPPNVEGARALYESIPANTALPFALFRRCNGLAYCAWKRGDATAGAALARLAADHAGDGGLVRLRVKALGLLSHMVDEPEATEVRNRAAHLTRMLEDEGLVHGAARSWG